MVTISPSTPLALAKNWLRSRVDDGAHCPCCGQFAKVYRRKVTSSAAHALIVMLVNYGQQWVHIPSVPGLSRCGGEIARLRYWGLVEEEAVLRPDGGRAGYWRVTSLGKAWVKGAVQVPKYARIYDGRLLSLDPTKQVTIKDALGAKFSYDDLMAGR